MLDAGAVLAPGATIKSGEVRGSALAIFLVLSTASTSFVAVHWMHFALLRLSCVSRYEGCRSRASLRVCRALSLLAVPVTVF